MRKILAAALCSTFLVSCTTNPTSGERIFTGFVNPQQENQIGSGQHQDILKEFNGVSDNQAMNALVNRIGAKLVPYAERKDVSWTFTVLNDDIVNAFAVPGGYIYITRGLLNLAQDESQVAAVLGHEMGHINARHSAQQMSQAMIANIGLQALGIATGSNVATQAGGIGADLFIKKYSRAHELEADALAVRYLTAAGYDPYANTKFLDMLEKYTELERRMAGSAAGNDLASFFATHPPTPERVVRARQLADQAAKPANPIVNRDVYLRAVDGTVYGDSAEQGFVRGNEFIHPGLKIRFAVPDGFRLKNTPKQVIAENDSGAALVFDMGQGMNDDPAAYLGSVWAANARVSGEERITVNGMAGATAATVMTANGSQKEGRLVAVSAGNNKFYRFVFLTPPGQMTQYATGFQRTTYSLKGLKDSDVKQLSPNRVRLVRVQSGDTIQSMAAKMSVKDYAVERFCLLNGLSPTDSLKPGTIVKTVQPF